MPSFDVVSEVDKHELTNAVDQANRELANRFDFKGQDAKFVLDDFVITQSAPSDFQLQQMLDILRGRLVSRKIDVRALDIGEVETNLAGARQKITVKQGIEQPVAKKLVATLKEAKLKVEGVAFPTGRYIDIGTPQALSMIHRFASPSQSSCLTVK